MSEAADELERMAEEFDRKSAHYQAATLATQSTSTAQICWAEAARMLRDRVIELQRIGSSKPSHIDAGQWWSMTGGGPGRIDSVYDDAGGKRVAVFGDEPLRDEQYTEAVMLTSSRWHYHGDGYHPAQKL
jgi:hypothetical protein